MKDSDTILRFREEAESLKAQTAKVELEEAEARRAIYQMQTLPHRHYIPRMSHDGLEWVAVAEFHDGSKLVGRGACPNAALMDFSNQWLGIKGE